MKLSDFREGRDQILAINGKTEADMAENLLILREWMKKLPHIPSDMLRDDFLEICFIKNKFSIEKTKGKIEEYCSIKAAQRYQYLFERVLAPSKENTFYVSYPIFTEDFYRIHIVIIRDEKQYNHMEDVRNLITQLDLYTHCGYSNGEILIFDYSRCSAMLLSKFRINFAADCIQVALEGYSARLKALHVVNKSAKTVMSLFMKLFPAKFAARVVLHDDYESLRKAIPAKYLPSELGGELKSYDEMLKDWDKLYEEEHDIIKSIIETKARKDLKQADLYKDEMKGTFKKLAID